MTLLRKLALILGVASRNLALGAVIDFPQETIEGEPIQIGSAIAGEDLTINYNLDELQKCTGSNRLFKSFWTIEYQFDNGEVFSRGITSGQAVIETPADATSLLYWFHNYSIGTFPCDDYDSQKWPELQC